MTTLQNRLAELDLAIDRADAALMALEEQWRPPYNHSQPLEDSLGRTPNSDPRHRIGALGLLEKLALAREKLNALRAEKCRLQLEGYPEERLVALEAEHKAAYEAQMAAQAHYRQLRAEQFRLQSELTSAREQRRQLAGRAEHHERVATAAADEAARHRAAMLTLQQHARALVAGGRAQWYRGLAAYVADLDADASGSDAA